MLLTPPPGTFLGDYFGILMKEKVTGFPFNVLDNPMYVGSTLLFLAHSLRCISVPAFAARRSAHRSL